MQQNSGKHSLKHAMQTIINAHLSHPLKCASFWINRVHISYRFGNVCAESWNYIIFEC